MHRTDRGTSKSDASRARRRFGLSVVGERRRFVREARPFVVRRVDRRPLVESQHGQTEAEDQGTVPASTPFDFRSSPRRLARRHFDENPILSHRFGFLRSRITRVRE
ncbi:MAG TPA: hypothetical protein DCQ98_02830 [Planctomycetaceae bacterium]|nr:hypothetical protein [Planctomycetaceae bacterium]